MNIEEARAAHFFGARAPRTFREAATRFLEENQHKRSLDRDARALAVFDPYIGELQLKQVHSGTLQVYIRDRRKAGASPGTINRDLAVVRRILNLCARLWRDESDRPWLDTAPLIQMLRHPNRRAPYPLSMEEQRLLFSQLAEHLARMALFKVNTGTREHEVCSLRWRWEVRIPELDTSVFIIPADYVKNGIERYVVSTGAQYGPPPPPLPYCPGIGSNLSRGFTMIVAEHPAESLSPLDRSVRFTNDAKRRQ